MITVTYHRKWHRLSVEGHAQTGEQGKDLVCAAVTILVRTLAANVLELSATEQRHVREPHIKLEDGCAEVSCKPVHRFSSMVELIYDSVIRGLLLLSEQYPEAVTYNEVKG
jgi:uncharacterized protein YsxB (DUF464 family)